MSLVCPTCLGSQENAPESVELGRSVKCSSCSGRGWVLDEAALEKAVKAAANAYRGFDPVGYHPAFMENPEEVARAAVLAYLEHKEE